MLARVLRGYDNATVNPNLLMDFIMSLKTVEDYALLMLLRRNEHIPLLAICQIFFLLLILHVLSEHVKINE